MSERRTALITGITGQDGSYLAEHLLGLGYEVHGTIRTTTADVADTRIGHLVEGDEPQVSLHVTDLGDSHSLMRLIETLAPDEVYNLAAQSHVRASFDQPVHTGDVTGLGAVRLLEAIRQTDPSIRFYQASSSEMFGAAPPPQSESTPFHPRSPYAVAKVYAYWATRNHRESYGIHASNGILHNHECVAAGTPVIVRRDGFIDVVPIDELVPHRSSPRSGTRYSSDGGRYEVWDGSTFVRCLARTATWHDEEIVGVETRGAVVDVTSDHEVHLATGSARAAGRMTEGDAVELGSQPALTYATTLLHTEAWFLGLLTADGYIAADAKHGRIVNGDEALLAEAAASWTSIAAGSAKKSEGPKSAFSGGRTPVVNFSGNRLYLRMLRAELYTGDGHKRVPKRVLNAAPPVQRAYLEGYSAADGLEAGHGTDRCKSFRTTSPVLAAGLTWLARASLGRQVSLYRQLGALGGGESWLINLASGQLGGKGVNLRKPQDEVRRLSRTTFTGWMFDLATESGRFAAGVGGLVVSNSPRRGKQFVTRKITSTIPRLLTGEQKTLKLGNLDARRDWGHARDYVEAMQLMLALDEPVDLVIGTGESHSVRDFLDAAFAVVDRDWSEFVEIDPRFYRPAEVDSLHADPAKAFEILGWRPRTSFAELVEEMVRADCATHSVNLPAGRGRA